MIIGKDRETAALIGNVHIEVGSNTFSNLASFKSAKEIKIQIVVRVIDGDVTCKRSIIVFACQFTRILTSVADINHII